MYSSLLLALVVSASTSDSPTQTISPTSVHITEGGRKSWRRPVHIDAIESWLVSGKPLTSKVMGAPTWANATRDDNGKTTIPRGGWGLFIFESDGDTPALLDASAFSEAWINGLPRGGDVYGDGNTRLPFMLRKGRNEVMLRSGRGQPNPTVTTRDELARTQVSPGATRVALLGSRDRTVPDAISGQDFDEWAAVLIHNVDETPLTGARIEAMSDGLTTSMTVPTIPALSFLKVPMRVRSQASDDKNISIDLRLRDAAGGLLDTDTFTIRVRTPSQWRKHTFLSSIDGSVQYYGLVPAVGETDGLPGTVLSLHGAAVQGGKQASCYKPRPWCMVAAPTNRRPYGFDWEEWGRLDAIEVLHDAQRRYPNDPKRTWLTGHSMGGHGTWNIGLTMPDQFAAIAPSAGWSSFWTYGGPPRYEQDGGVREILRTAANPSDTNLLLPNADRFGVYILHGDADDNVPVSEARAMRDKLSSSHSDFAYYERPGAGHWWGDQCMDWPPLFEFLERHTLGTGGHRDALTFVTVDPSASSTCDWVTIEQQQQSLQLSRVDLVIERSGDNVLVKGKTKNVSHLSFDTNHPDLNAHGTILVDLDGCEPFTVLGETAYLARGDDGGWESSRPIPASEKNPHRSGRLRSAWNHGVTLVVGTSGTPEETTWNSARARQDAERWWYRGNGLVTIVNDVDFDPEADPDRGLMLYGNQETNTAWEAMLGDSPIQVTRDSVLIGDRQLDGPLAAAFVRPRPGSDVASVGVVTGTSGEGERFAATMPLFFPGVGWPDWMIVEPGSLESGEDGIIELGFFDRQFTLDPSQSAARENVH